MDEIETARFLRMVTVIRVISAIGAAVGMVFIVGANL
jgi:hypothetical protein